MNRDRSLFRHFGLSADTLYWGADHEKYSTEILDAVESRRLLCIDGEFGTGKTTLVRETLKRIPRLRVVDVVDPNKERMNIGAIMDHAIYALSDESPRRTAAARSIQLSRIIGSLVVHEGQQVVIIIDNAHRLHKNTLMAIKDMRESTIFKLQSFLFTVILIGHGSVRPKLEGMGEVNLRTRKISLRQSAWMPVQDRIEYLDTIYRDVITDTAKARLAAVYETPLALDSAIENLFLDMKAAGVRVLDETMIASSPGQLRQLLGLSLKEVDRLTGIPRSTISDIEHGRNEDPDLVNRIMGALNEQMSSRTSARRMAS
jgi:type II secretory pathway predicted ATPase ExeA